MPLELFAVDIFKALLLPALLFTANWIRKKFKPTFKHIKRITEVSDRVDKIEKDLDLVKKRQTALIEVDNRPIFILNGKGEVIKVNSAWLDMTEMKSEKEALGFGYLQAIPEDDREMMVERNELFVEHPSVFSGEIRFLKVKSKQIITAYCRSEPIKNGEILIETIGILDEKK
jgi:PAS domain-containing protein